jgi:hypothetical protein
LFLIDHGCVTEEVALSTGFLCFGRPLALNRFTQSSFRRLLSNICGFTSEPLINPIVSSPRRLIRRKYSGPVPSGLP